MPKNKLIHVVAVLFVSNLLWGCSSKDDEDASVWASTDAIYSAASITDSRATISSNGDIVLVWQEQETEERADTDKDATFPSETHKVLYSKTSVNVKYYDSASASWSADKQLRVGHWEKLKSGIVDGAETVFQENINNTFVGNSVVAINSNGDAVVAWVQLGESADVVDDAGRDHLLFVSSYTAADSSWRVPLALSTNLTLNLSAKTPNNTTMSSTVTGDVTVQNKLALTLSDSNVAQLVWLGRAQKSNFDTTSITINPAVNVDTDLQTTAAIDEVIAAIDLNINDKVNVYQNTFDGSAWSSPVMISDGKGSAKDIKLVSRNQTSGVALWLQQNEKHDSALSCNDAQFPSPLNLYSNWFNSVDGWHSTPALFNDGIAEVEDFSIASNNAGAIWASWSQISNASYPCAPDLTTKNYTVSKISTISSSEFSGDIDTDLTNGVWSAAANIQTDIAATATIDESALASNASNIAVDSDGNAFVAWVEKGDATVARKDRKDSIIRANVNNNGSWLSESFIVSDTAVFDSIQPIEKTVPNNHLSPKVVSTGKNAFTISWQYWSVSRGGSGYKLYSLDYDASTNTTSDLRVVTESASPVVNQMQMFSVRGGVEMLWSQETATGVQLNKSVKN